MPAYIGYFGNQRTRHKDGSMMGIQWLRDRARRKIRQPHRKHAGKPHTIRAGRVDHFAHPRNAGNYPLKSTSTPNMGSYFLVKKLPSDI